MYGQEQDEQRRLDLRSREDALSRYRAASAAGVGQQQQDTPYELETDPVQQRWLAQQQWRRDNPSPEEEWQPRSPEEQAQWEADIIFREQQAAKHLPSAAREEGPMSQSQVQNRTENVFKSYVIPLIPENERRYLLMALDSGIADTSMELLIREKAAEVSGAQLDELSLEDAMTILENRVGQQPERLQLR
jgi:hypothetical protein